MQRADSDMGLAHMQHSQQLTCMAAWGNRTIMCSADFSCSSWSTPSILSRQSSTSSALADASAAAVLMAASSGRSCISHRCQCRARETAQAQQCKHPPSSRLFRPSNTGPDLGRVIFASEGSCWTHKGSMDSTSASNEQRTVMRHAPMRDCRCTWHPS